jgi:predicted dehydrogenase
MVKNVAPNSPRPVRAAIAGAGLMGRWHADSIRRVGGKVCVIVDRDRRRASELAGRYPGAEAASDWSSALAGGVAEVAHICTPVETHEALTAQALEAGLHALVEKPLAETAEATSALLALAASRHVLLCPVHQFLFQPGVVRAGRAVERIRPMLHVDVVICSAGAEQGSPDRDRIAAEILPNPLALIARLVGEPIQDGAWQVQHAARGELRASGQIGSVSVSVLISMGGRPTANLLRLIGTRGTVHVDLFHGFSVLEGGAVSRARKITHPFTLAGGTLFSATGNLLSRAARREPAYPGLRELIRRFYQAIGTAGQPPISAAETMDVALVRDALFRKMCGTT